MRIYGSLDASGRLVYFEVDNALLSRRAASRLVSRIAGVSLFSSPSYWPFSGDDVFCKFELDGKHLELWEPFGDNSRFHIAAKPMESCDALERVRAAFEKHRPITGFTRWLILLAGLVLVWFRFVRH
jgi:hypothetical protein